MPFQTRTINLERSLERYKDKLKISQDELAAKQNNLKEMTTNARTVLGNADQNVFKQENCDDIREAAGLIGDSQTKNENVTLGENDIAMVIPESVENTRTNVYYNELMH